jgi:predicted nucleic-acid-binding Zn-ribbon protein
MAKERQPDNQPRCIKCGNLSFVRNIDASSQARAIHPATGARLP